MLKLWRVGQLCPKAVNGRLDAAHVADPSISIEYHEPIDMLIL
jgi:hypothetical protein